MFDKIVTWLKGLSDFMAKTVKGDAAQMVRIIMGIIREVQASGKSGADKRALAFSLLVAKLPEIIEIAVALMKQEDGCPGDADCDGVPDAIDKCPRDPNCQ